MGGMKSLFTKLIPIIMLVCFICLGITHTFGRFDAETGQSNITYLSKDTIETGTQDHPYELTYYELDINGYMQGMNNDFLHRSIQDVIDIETYTAVLNTFENIWKDGYQLGDVIRTIGNAVILTINTIIFILNIILVPMRIISGILLTAFSFVGINTTRPGIITTALDAIIDNASIPFLNPIFNQDRTSIIGTTWLFNENLRYLADSSFQGTYREYELDFTIPESGATYTKMVFWVNWAETRRTVQYYYIENNELQSLYVYDNGWIYQNCREITIVSHNFTQNDYELFMTFLDVTATQQ